MGNKYHLELMSDEADHLAKIDFSNKLGHDAFLSNQDPILALLKSLGDRNAIPKHRLNYWSDPDYNTGRLKQSHQGVFERNGCIGRDIYTHPHFLQFLRYFLFGPDLPEGLMTRFEDEVSGYGPITSGDIMPMCKYARQLTREYGLEPHDAAEEFFKLCLEIDVDLSTAYSVEKSVKSVR